MMRKRAVLLLSLVAAMMLACSGMVLAQPDTTTPTDSSQKKGVIPDEYIVKLKENAPDPEKAKKEKEQKYGLTGKHTYKYALKGFSAHIPKNKVEEVRNDPEVEFVQEDREVKASGSTVSLATGDQIPTGVRRIEGATTSMVHSNSSVPVAVIDSGIATHTDLNRSTTKYKNCVNPSSNPSANDDNGHGTHVAGTIGAKNNGSGVVGVAPDTPLRSVKVLDRKGSGTTSTVICGIDWVTQNSPQYGGDIKVANMSIGGWNDGLRDDGNCGKTTGYIDLYHQAICKSTAAGVTYAVAAGNDTWALEDKRWTAVPAAYDEVLAVTAMADSNGTAGGTWSTPSGCGSSATEEKYASFSNWATPPVSSTGTPAWTDDRNHTIAAPGVCIKSTWLSGSYKTISGTSMASPHMAGMAALCIGSGQCSGTPSEVMAKLRGDAQTQDGNVKTYGFTGDPTSSPIAGKQYDYLGYAGGY